MKNIAIFQNDLSVGGIQKSIINLLNNIDINKYNIDLYLFNTDNFYESAISNKINIIYLKNHFLINNLPFRIAKILKPKYHFTKEYDIAIDFNSYQSCCSLAALETKAKHKIMFIHNDIIAENQVFKYKFRSFFLKNKYQYFDSFVGVSNGVIEPFKKYSRQYNKKYYVVSNFVDSKEIIKKSQEKINFELDSKKYNLVSIGRLVYQKGFDLLIEHFSNIINSNPNYMLYIIGDGSEKTKLQKLIKKYNLINKVILLGNKPNPYPYINKMDGFVLTSRYEGQGIVFYEAKVLGLDIFMPKNLEKYASDISGTTDIEQAILNANKHSKVISELKEYNQEVLKSINKVFEVS